MADFLLIQFSYSNALCKVQKRTFCSHVTTETHGPYSEEIQ